VQQCLPSTVYRLPCLVAFALICSSASYGQIPQNGPAPAVGATLLSLNDINETLTWTLQSVTQIPFVPINHTLYDGVTAIGTVTVSIGATANAAGDYPVTASASITAPGYAPVSSTMPPTNTAWYSVTPSNFPSTSRLGSFHAPIRALAASGVVTVNWTKTVPGYIYGTYKINGTSTHTFLDIVSARTEVWQCTQAVPNGGPFTPGP
jgi:hypothetical protein